MLNLFGNTLSSQLGIAPLLPNSSDNFYYNDKVLTLKNINTAIVNKLTNYKISDITYKGNNLGFRCDDFVKQNNKILNVVFLGCSLTFGYCLPYEETWAYKVICKLRNDINPKIKYYNLSSPGASIDTIVRTLDAYCHSYTPNLIIGLLPPAHRIELIADENTLVNVYANANYKFSQLGIKDKSRKAYLHFIDNYKKEFLDPYNTYFFGDENMDAYRLAKNIEILKTISKSMNSKILLMNWEDDAAFFKNIEDDAESFKKDVFLSYKIFDCANSNYPLALDGVHPGGKTHTNFANLVYEDIKNAALSI